MQVGRTLFQSMIWRGLYYLSTFVINLFIARHFEASISGAIYYISTIYAFVLLLASLSFDSGIIYFAAKAEIALGKLFTFSLLWSLCITGFVFFIITSFFNNAYTGVSEQLILFSAIVFVLGNLLTTYFSGLFYANNDFVTPNVIIISSTVILILLIPFKGSPLNKVINDANYFYFYFGSFLLQGIFILAAAKIKLIKNNLFQLLSLTEYKKLLQYCALAFSANIIYFLIYRIDYWFVEKYCTAEQLGNYIQVSKIVQLFLILPTIFAAVIFPMTSSGNNQSILKLVKIISRSIFTLYFIISLLLYFVSENLFPFVFGESFSKMYQPFVLLIPGILALSGLFTLTAYFSGRNRIKVNIIGSLFALVFIITADIIFIPHYGINAAALISSFGYVVYYFYVLMIFKLENASSFSEFFLFKKSDWFEIRKGLININK